MSPLLFQDTEGGYSGACRGGKTLQRQPRREDALDDAFPAVNFVYGFRRESPLWIVTEIVKMTINPVGKTQNVREKETCPRMCNASDETMDSFISAPVCI